MPAVAMQMLSGGRGHAQQLNPDVDGGSMRSDLVFGAVRYVPNRFLLTKLAATAMRKFHRPNTRISDTANEVLARFCRTHPMSDETCRSRPPAVRIDRIRGVSEKSQPGSKVKRASTTEPVHLAETA